MGAIPQNATKLKRRELAFGEVTGHSHAIADLDSAYLLQHGDQLFMVVTADGGIEVRENGHASIIHGKVQSDGNMATATESDHAPQQCVPGEYQIVQQQESTMWGRQNVID